MPNKNTLLSRTLMRTKSLFLQYQEEMQMYDQIRHFYPYPHSQFRKCIIIEERRKILDINKFMKKDTSWNILCEENRDLESEFFDILILEDVIDVIRDRNKFTLELNEQIDIICYCNFLIQASLNDGLKIPCEISLPDMLSDQKFSTVIHALEEYGSGSALLAAAFLLADIIETNLNLSGKTTEAINEYWNKRYHDAITFAQKAIEISPSLQGIADTLLLHIKAVAGEYYSDIKQRINTHLLEPNIETFKYFKKDPVQTLLYGGNFLGQSISQIHEEFYREENNQNGLSCK
jgi:hypothetical protein